MLGSSSTVRVRTGRPADARELAEVFETSWRYAYVGILPAQHLDSLIIRRGKRWWASTIRSGEPVLVLEVGGTIAGYATFGPARRRGRYQGEIYELYLLPAYQGLGFGELLFESCRYELDQKRLNGLVVWALADNHGALDFYWRRGGRPVAEATDCFGSSSLKKVAYGWR
ncbi:MAG: N-acetyltransferase family protein [Hyphomicrobiaceae bacterium]